MLLYQSNLNGASPAAARVPLYSTMRRREAPNASLRVSEDEHVPIQLRLLDGLVAAEPTLLRTELLVADLGLRFGKAVARVAAVRVGDQNGRARRAERHLRPTSTVSA